MAMGFADVQKIVAYISAHLDEDVSLQALARRARLSRFHLHREFAKATGETPHGFTSRLRLAHAAVLLLTTRRSVLDVALASGFRSHETFCRAFHRRFEMTPRAYRRRGFTRNIDATQARAHAEFVDRTAACLGLYRMQPETGRKENQMKYSVTKKDIEPQPVLVVRRRVKRSGIAATIGQTLPLVFGYAAQHGIALTGLPFTRYIEMGPGLVTMEPGMRIAGPVPDAPASDTGVIAETLPGGPVATTTHYGPYDGLPDAYAEVEQWIEQQGLTAAGYPWESYVNDPAEYPDPKDWKTEVFWPVR